MNEVDERIENNQEDYFSDLGSRLLRRSIIDKAKTAGKIAIPVAAIGGASGCSSVTLPPRPEPCEGGTVSSGPITTEFQTIVDTYRTRRFRWMSEASAIDWITVGQAAFKMHNLNVHKAIENLLLQSSRYCFGFPVNVMEHSLQAATRADRAGKNDAWVLAALLHDIAIPITYYGHAEIGAGLLRENVFEELYYAVYHHSVFELEYYGDAIGQPTDWHEAFQDEDWYDIAHEFTAEFIQTSYDPNYASQPLEYFLPLIKDMYEQESFREFDTEVTTTTTKDCYIEEIQT